MYRKIEEQKESEKRSVAEQVSNKKKTVSEMDNKVLRFNAYSQVQRPHTQDSRDLILLYYLIDDTIQINQIIEPNSGYDGSSVFLRRMKLPKNWNLEASLPGNDTNVNILNVLGDGFMNGRFVADKQETNKKKTEFIKVRRIRQCLHPIQVV